MCWFESTSHTLCMFHGRTLIRSSANTFFFSQVGAEAVEMLLEDAAEDDENATAAIEDNEPTFHLQVYNYVFKHRYCIVIFAQVKHLSNEQEKLQSEQKHANKINLSSKLHIQEDRADW